MLIALTHALRDADRRVEGPGLLPKCLRGTVITQRILQERDAPGSQVYLTTRQMLLVDRMARRVSDILKGGAPSRPAPPVA